jgi:UDP-N-acetyl-D-mannosaminuronate dehydrogenase
MPELGPRGTRRVVAGLTPRCTVLAAEFVRRLAADVITVSRIEAAEMTKGFEKHVADGAR